MADDRYVLTVVYEFDTGPPETHVIYRNREAWCDVLASRLERNVIRYHGELGGREVIQAITVVFREDALEGNEIEPVITPA